MQNLSQIGEPACPQIFDLAPFLRIIALKTEAADEVDVIVVLQTAKQEVTKELGAGVPGFVLLKAGKDSPLQKYTNTDGYIIPDKLRASWFFGLVQKAINELAANSPVLPV